MKFDRDAQAVVGAEALCARQHKQGGRIQALLQQLGKGVADPLDARSFGLIFKRNYQHGLTGRGRSLGRCGCGQEQEEDWAEPEKFQGKWFRVRTRSLSVQDCAEKSLENGRQLVSEG